LITCALPEMERLHQSLGQGAGRSRALTRRASW
jgi:hypothetical protein